MVAKEHEYVAYAYAEHASAAYADDAGDAHVVGDCAGGAGDVDGDDVGGGDDDHEANVCVERGCVGCGDGGDAASSMWACRASCRVHYSTLSSLCSSRHWLVPNGSSMSSWSTRTCKLPIGALDFAS